MTVEVLSLTATKIHMMLRRQRVKLGRLYEAFYKERTAADRAGDAGRADVKRPGYLQHGGYQTRLIQNNGVIYSAVQQRSHHTSRHDRPGSNNQTRETLTSSHAQSAAVDLDM